MSAATQMMSVGCLVLGQALLTQGSPCGQSNLGLFECRTAARYLADSADLAYAETCSDIVERFPDAPTALPPQDIRLLCPFARMNQRVGNLPRADEDPNAWNVYVADVQANYQDFGLDADNMGYIIAAPPRSRLGAWRYKRMMSLPLAHFDSNLRRLCPELPFETVSRDCGWPQKGTSRDCGFTWSLGATHVEPVIVAETLSRLRELSAPDGHVTIEHLYQAQREACQRDYAIHVATGIPTKDEVDHERETLVVAPGAITQMQLIFAFTGGVDHGFALWSDVARILNAQLPERKTKFEMNFALLGLLPDPAPVANTTLLL